MVDTEEYVIEVGMYSTFHVLFMLRRLISSFYSTLYNFILWFSLVT